MPSQAAGEGGRVGFSDPPDTAGQSSHGDTGRLNFLRSLCRRALVSLLSAPPAGDSRMPTVQL